MERVISAEERRTSILKMLREKNRVTIAELVRKFSVTEVSIRNDLALLEEKKLLVRVKGGAVNIHNFSDSEDIPVSHKQTLHSREKQLIGKFAASLVKDGESIIMDSGSTTMEIAKQLDPAKKLTVITNAMDIAIALNARDSFQVIVLGGMIRHISYSTVGMIAESALKSFYCDKLFLGVDSINIRDGISTPNIEEASLNQAMIASAKEVIAVFDSSKFDRRSFAHIASLDKIDTIITDSHIPDAMREYITMQRITLHTVDIDDINT